MASSSRGLLADRVTFGYGARHVLTGTSLQFGRNEMLALAGPNGAGKSTLLRLLAGILRPVSGRVLLDGQPIERISPRARARRVAVVAQRAETSLLFSVDDMVRMGRAPHVSLLGSAGPSDEAAVARAVAETGIEGLRGRRFAELSGGEQQRVVLAMALAQEADFLLLDEPTVHLDLHHQAALLELLHALRASRGIGVLAVMHDLNLASLYFDRLALLDGGKIIADGPSADVLAGAELRWVFEASLSLISHPQTGDPQILLNRDSPR